MKKTLCAIGIAFSTMSAMTSCEIVTNIAQAYSDENLPLVSKTITLSSDFATVTNNTVIDVEFTQEAKLSAELLCPEECQEFVVVKAEKGNLKISLDSMLNESQRNQISNMLMHSKLLLSAPSLNAVCVNGSSVFCATGDLKADKFDVLLNGSGDVLLQGLMCNGAVTLNVNGSGDVVIARELKAKSVDANVNGSGDVMCTIITAYDVIGQVNGSGDMVFNNLTAVNSQLGVNGSGDLKADNIKADDVVAALSGSGDVVLNGVCQRATLSIIGSGDISAKALEAQNVSASVTNSGDITCNAQKTLSAIVNGSGDILYKGNPSVTIQGNKDNINKL